MQPKNATTISPETLRSLETSESLGTWQDLPGFFEPRSPAFATLRKQLMSTMFDERMTRMMNDPTKTADEEALGVIREQIEPQCRNAIFSIWNKGYETFNSGFGPGNLQIVDGVFTDLPAETIESLMAEGFFVYNSDEGNISIGFLPQSADYQAITRQWDQLAEILPDKGYMAHHDEQALNRFFTGAQTPGCYGCELAIRLEDEQSAAGSIRDTVLAGARGSEDQQAKL